MVSDAVPIPFYYIINTLFGMIRNSVPGVSMVRDTMPVKDQSGTGCIGQFGLVQHSMIKFCQQQINSSGAIFLLCSYVHHSL